MTTHHGMAELTGISAHCKTNEEIASEDRFGRMFPLPASYVSADVLGDIGKFGGPMDDNGRPIQATTVPVGHVFFGQFIDHDITLDVSSSFERINTPAETPNVRTPTLDLDSIYGAGPESHPFLYDNRDNPFKHAKLLTGADMPSTRDSDKFIQENDVLRNHQSVAIIGDHRNDENRIISQLQLGMIKFHNLVAQTLYEESVEAAEKGNGLVLERQMLFSEARRSTTWHYQWGVVNDFLVTMCGQSVINDILACGRQYYCPSQPYIPIEFAVAAYRFGHSMAPTKIRVRKDGDDLDLFGNELGNGFSPVAGKFAIVDWNELFFAKDGGGIQGAQKLDTKMATNLLQLPFITEGERSLATRNLLRGNSFLLPGGDKIAEKMGRDASEISKVVDIAKTISAGRITEGVPLWLYCLAEAQEVGRETTPGAFDKGEGLGPVGARIVAEVLIGLLELDEHSYLGANRNWTPGPEWDSIGKILLAVNPSIV